MARSLLSPSGICPKCGARVERSRVLGRPVDVEGVGGPHCCRLPVPSLLVPVECTCGARVERDESDLSKWEPDGSPHDCSVRPVVHVGARGDEGPQSARARAAGNPDESRPAATRAKATTAAPGSVAAAAPRAHPASKPLDLLPRVLGG